MRCHRFELSPAGGDFVEQFQHGLPVLSGSQRPFVGFASRNRVLACVGYRRLSVLQSAVDVFSGVMATTCGRFAASGRHFAQLRKRQLLFDQNDRARRSIATLIGMVGLNACSFSPCVAAPITITVT